MANGVGGSPFDLIETTMMATINRIMGNRAEWIPSTTGVLVSGLVLFNDPTKVESMNNMNWEDENPWIEYGILDFAGLRELGNKSSNNEVVSIYFTRTGPPTDYYVRKVKAGYDGKTLIAKLALK